MCRENYGNKTNVHKKRGVIPVIGGHFQFYPYQQRYPENPSISPENTYYHQIKPVEEFEPAQNTPLDLLAELESAPHFQNNAHNYHQPILENSPYSNTPQTFHNPQTYPFTNSYVPKSAIINPLNYVGPQTFAAQNNVYRTIVPNNLQRLQQNGRLVLSPTNVLYRNNGLSPLPYPIAVKNPNANFNIYKKLQMEVKKLEQLKSKALEQKENESDDSPKKNIQDVKRKPAFKKALPKSRKEYDDEINDKFAKYRALANHSDEDDEDDEDENDDEDSHSDSDGQDTRQTGATTNFNTRYNHTNTKKRTTDSVNKLSNANQVQKIPKESKTKKEYKSSWFLTRSFES